MVYLSTNLNSEVQAVNLKMAFETYSLHRNPLTAIVSHVSICQKSVCAAVQILSGSLCAFSSKYLLNLFTEQPHQNGLPNKGREELDMHKNFTELSIILKPHQRHEFKLFLSTKPMLCLLYHKNIQALKTDSGRLGKTVVPE